MKEIALTQGKVALVDDGDFEWLNQWKWYSYSSRRYWYAGRKIRIREDKQFGVNMHRFILGVSDSHLFVDHIDGDGLNNQRCNLRIATVAQNQHNSFMRRGAASGYKGVAKDSRNKWQARILIDGINLSLGSYVTAEQAARAYDNAAREHFGEFARVNFPLPGEQPARRIQS